MKRLHTYLILITVCTFVMPSCTEYDKKGWEMSEDEFTDATIKGFSVKSTYNDGNYQYAALIRNDSIILRVPYEFDFNIIKQATAEVTLNNMATIYPLAETELDYTAEDIVFTVTAADRKTTKEYPFGWEPHGFGKAYELWYKNWENLGFQTFDDQGNELTFDVNTTSVAVCGDYLVTARTHKVFDMYTCELQDFELNLTGIPRLASGADPQIFWLTNDDQGNMVGCTLSVSTDAGAVFTEGAAYNIYTWTDPREAPRLVWASNQPCGRRMDVRGDINGTAYITSWLIGTGNPEPNTTFHRLKIEDGVATELSPLNSQRIRLTGTTNWPVATLMEPAEETTYFVFTNYNSLWDHFPCLSFGTAPGRAGYLSLGPVDTGYVGWGDQYRHYAGVYTINGENYLTLTNGYSDCHYLIVVQADEVKNNWGIQGLASYYVPDVFKWQWNPNRGQSIAVVERDGAAYLYVMAGGSGIACHVLETVWGEDKDENEDNNARRLIN